MSVAATAYRTFARAGWAASHFREATKRGATNQTLRYRPVGAAVNLSLSGVTRTGAGAALGLCSLVLLQTGGDIPTQRQTSNAGGGYQFDNPGSGPFRVDAYLAGAPDRAGTTRNDLAAPQNVDVYLRDPTVADAGGGAAAFRVVGSPVIRRISQ